MRAWFPHCALGLLLVLELVVARVQHQSTEQLDAARASGSVQEKLDALHILTNRAPGREPVARFGSEYGAALAHEVYEVYEVFETRDQRLREYAFSTDICKFEYPAWQEMLVEQRLPANAVNSHWWRSFVLYKRKVGGQIVGASLRLRMQELRWFCDALQGIAPDKAALREHMRSLDLEIRSRLKPTATPEGPQ
ncbi:MAG: hypothetical protein ACI8QZ_002207 [Chlamydiales bacterium]|jgi:hypothetical protein